MNGPFVRRLHSLTLGLIARWSPADDPLHQAFDREIHANWTPQSSREVRSDVESDVVHLTSLLKDGPRSSLPTALAALPLVLASMVTFAVYPTPIVVKWDNSPLADLASGIDGLAVLALGLIVLWSPRVLPRRVTLGLFVLPTAVGAFLGAIADGPDALGGLGLLYLPIRLANAMAVVGLG